MNIASLVTVLSGPAIAAAVSALKGFKPVEKNPKWTAFIASAGVAALQVGFHYHGVDVGSIATQILVPFAGSVTSYEVVTNGIGGK